MIIKIIIQGVILNNLAKFALNNIEEIEGFTNVIQAKGEKIVPSIILDVELSLSNKQIKALKEKIKTIFQIKEISFVHEERGV